MIHRIVLLAVALGAIACSSSSEPEDQRSIALRIVGTVVAEPGGDPIEGAQVDFGTGGVFGAPLVLKSANTDMAGRYEIQDTVTYTDPCPFMWMQSSADGYRSTRNIEDIRVGVTCTSATQNIDIPLEPIS